MNDIPFSANFTEPVGSPIRELFTYLSRPGMISFAGGYPSPGLLDGFGLIEASRRAFATGAEALQYGATEGAPVLRAALASLCAERGISCTASDILVTTGSQQALDLLIRVFIEPGDIVYVEAPTYPAATQALRLAGARIEQVPVDEDGLQTKRLEAMLVAASKDDRPKFFYTVPTFSNPCGALLTEQRREHLVRLAAEYGFLILEDDPYGELSFVDEHIAPVHSVGARLLNCRNPVIYLSSLSKTVAPSLRIGWMIAPPDVIRRCAIAKQTIDLCTSSISQLIAAEYLQSGRYPETLRRARNEYALRMQILIDAVQEEAGTLMRAQKPRGGLFVWIALDEQLDPKILFDASVESGVVYVPGAAFYASNPVARTMRLSFAAQNSAQIVEGVRRLGKAASVAIA